MKTSRIDRKSALSVETLPVHHEVLYWNLFFIRSAAALQWVLGILSLLLKFLLRHLYRKYEFIIFVWSRSLSRWFFDDKYPIRTFPNLPFLLSECLLSKFLRDKLKNPERCLIVLSFQTEKLLINLLLKSNDVESLLQKIWWTLCMSHQIVFHTEFSYQSGRLGHFADSKSIPLEWDHLLSILIVAILLKNLLLLFERLSQRCHLCQIDDVLKCGDFMIDFHMFFHQWIMTVTDFWVVCRFQEFWKKKTFRLRCSVCFTQIRLIPLTDKILQHDSELTINPWFIFLLDDFVINQYQVSVLPHREELRKCVFWKESLSFWFVSRLRNFDS